MPERARRQTDLHSGRARGDGEPPSSGAPLRRRRLLAVALLALAATAVALAVILGGSGTTPTPHPAARPTASSGTGGAPPARSSPSSFAVGRRTVRFVDGSRTITFGNGSSGPRVLLTEVRYPALGPPGRGELTDAPAARASGPFPLVVFGHGFDVTPSLYARLLHSWAQAGYVVAAPVFPLENADAPGGPNEADLSNQPADMRFVITRMLAVSRSSADPLAGLLDAGAIAVAGHSDGGDTALAVAYDARFRDPRVDAAVILSGAQIPTAGGFTFAPRSPPLLATQGTADTVNPPSLTDAFYEAARPPKYLLRLLGAEHLPPYASEQPQLGIVERVTRAFLDGYLKRRPGARAQIVRLGSVPGTAALRAEP